MKRFNWRFWIMSRLRAANRLRIRTSARKDQRAEITAHAKIRFEKRFNLLYNRFFAMERARTPTHLERRARLLNIGQVLLHGGEDGQHNIVIVSIVDGIVFSSAATFVLITASKAARSSSFPDQDIRKGEMTTTILTLLQDVLPIRHVVVMILEYASVHPNEKTHLFSPNRAYFDRNGYPFCIHCGVLYGTMSCTKKHCPFVDMHHYTARTTVGSFDLTPMMGKSTLLEREECESSCCPC